MSTERWSKRRMDDLSVRLEHLGEMPLGSRADFARRWRVDEAAAKRTLDRLEDEGLAERARRGYTRRQQDIYWITPTGADFLYDRSHTHPSHDDVVRLTRLRQCGSHEGELKHLASKFSSDHAHGPFGDQEDHKHAPWSATVAGIREIFTRQALAEQVYRIAPDLLLSDNVILPFEQPEWVTGPGLGLTEIRWLRSGRLYHIVARYSDNWWVAFTYVGAHAKGVVLSGKRDGRFDGLSRYEWLPGERRPDNYDDRDTSFEPRPSLHVIVPADDWAWELAQEHLGQHVVSSSLWTGDRRHLAIQIDRSRSLVTDRFFSEQAGSSDPHAGNAIHGWLFSRPDLSAIDSAPAFRLVMLVSSFPSINRTEAKKIVRASGEVFRSVRESLCGARLVFEDAGGFYLDEKGMQFVADVSRIHVDVVRETCRRWLNPGQRDEYRAHNRGLAQLALAFFSAGGELVGGWRATTNVPGHTQNQPDAVIKLAAGPYRSGWYRVEFERSAVSPGEIAKKLRTYRRVAATGTPVPVLFVCETERAATRVVESEQHKQVAAATLKLATSEPIDGPGVWRTPAGPTQINCRLRRGLGHPVVCISDKRNWARGATMEKIVGDAR